MISLKKIVFLALCCLVLPHKSSAMEQELANIEKKLKVQTLPENVRQGLEQRKALLLRRLGTAAGEKEPVVPIRKPVERPVERPAERPSTKSLVREVRGLLQQIRDTDDAVYQELVR